MNNSGNTLPGPGNTGQPAGGTETGGSAEGGGQVTVNTSGGGSTSGGTSGTAGGSSETSGKDWEGLMALGIPLECDVTTTRNGTTTQSHTYVQNSHSMRSESPVSMGSCSQVAVIIKDKTMYMKCTDGVMFEGANSECVWVQFDLESQGQGAGSSATTDYSNLSSSDINCRPWLIDESKFVVDGKACTFEELYSMPQNPYG